MAVGFWLLPMRPLGQEGCKIAAALMGRHIGGEGICLRFYGCYNCHKRVAVHDDIVRKDFVAGNRRRAFLFSHVMNVRVGPKADRRLITGLYVVADVYCSDCGKILGWTYDKAYDEAQKYKESKTVLEKYKIVKDNW